MIGRIPPPHVLRAITEDHERYDEIRDGAFPEAKLLTRRVIATWIPTASSVDEIEIIQRRGVADNANPPASLALANFLIDATPYPVLKRQNFLPADFKSLPVSD